MAYRSLERFWQARHPPRYAALLTPSSPTFPHCSWRCPSGWGCSTRRTCHSGIVISRRRHLLRARAICPSSWTQAERESPPVQLELPEAAQTEFVICDQTISAQCRCVKASGSQDRAEIPRAALRSRMRLKRSRAPGRSTRDASRPDAERIAGRSTRGRCECIAKPRLRPFSAGHRRISRASPSRLRLKLMPAPAPA
jgi:hypothetical protein